MFIILNNVFNRLQLHEAFHRTFGTTKHARVGDALNAELGKRLMEDGRVTLPLNFQDSEAPVEAPMASSDFETISNCRTIQASCVKDFNK